MLVEKVGRLSSLVKVRDLVRPGSAGFKLPLLTLLATRNTCKDALIDEFSEYADF